MTRQSEAMESEGVSRKRLDELIAMLQSVDSEKMGDEMKRLMEHLASRGSNDDIEAMKRIGSEFEILSRNLLNLADLINRKFKMS